MSRVSDRCKGFSLKALQWQSGTIDSHPQPKPFQTHILSMIGPTHARLDAGAAFFIQPHYDDVALSCGATAAAFARAGHVPHIVTVFASEVLEQMVGEFASWKHARWKLSDPDAVLAARRDEDAAAARALGCSIRWLGLPDAIYRGDRYTSDAELYGCLHPDECALADHLATELLNLPEWRSGARVFVPLGVGSHVDHQLVFEAGRRLARSGVEVWAYEDCPYAIHTPAGVEARLKSVEGAVGSELLFEVSSGLDAKLDAIARYSSQLPVIFRFTNDWRGAVLEHARSLSSVGGAAERFWPVVGR